MSDLAALAVERHGDVPVATLSGEIDLSNADALRDPLDAAADHAAPGLVIDLSQVAYLDSAGVHLVHALTRLLERRGQRLVVVAPPGARVTRVFEIVELEASVPVRATVAEAVALLAR